MSIKKIQRKISLTRQFYPKPLQAGSRGRSLIGNSECATLDPFILLDYFSMQIPLGFTDHPHRGFETVTTVTKGSIYHEDFKGHRDYLNVGDVQWMTAGRGMVHAEMPATIDSATEGFQLWVNLPSEKKMMEPMYQEFRNKHVKQFNDDGLKVRVIAGESYGVPGGINPYSTCMYFDVTVGPGKEFKQKVSAGWVGFLFMFAGEEMVVSAGESKWTAKFEQMNIFEMKAGAEEISVKNSGSREAKFIFVAGKPIGEPIKQKGPFVMCTDAEIAQTLDDYANEKNGFEGVKNWQSQIRKLATDIHFKPEL
jgi:redox-sensitive bicupin YhaK (pirin superfamily)